MMNDALKVEHLTQVFEKKQVLQDVSFTVPTGSIFGFLGKNGAGKTTTMKILLGLLKPTAGAAFVFGERVHYGQTKTNRLIGYLPDVPEFYSFMKPKEYLSLCGEIANMPNERIKERIDELLELVGLENDKGKIGSFSRGMKQRLGIAQALFHKPKLLICDEPTSALDPIGRKEILDILAQIKTQTTVVFSTHILSDVDKICDHVAILDNNRIVLAGETQELKNKKRQEKVLLVFKEASDCQLFSQLPEIQNLQITAENLDSLIVMTSNAEQTLFKLMNLLTTHKIVPLKLEIQEPTLEDLFLEVVK